MRLLRSTKKLPCVIFEGGDTLLATGLTLVADNRQAGAINGKRLAATAPLSQFCPDHVAATQIIVRCEAKHSHEKGDLRRSDDFRNVRKALHIRVGAKVTLCLNKIWDVPTVQLGLMNGARGTIVAILYAAPGNARADGVQWLELATCRRRIKKLYFLGQTLNGRFAFSAAISDPSGERFAG